jgi:hypothetical protein
MYRKRFLSLLILLLLFTLASCFKGYPSYEEVVESRSKIKPVAFEKQKWFDDRGIGVEVLWEIRPRLARDLINRNLLIGKSVDEVTELLGEGNFYEKTNTLVYEAYVENGVADPIFIEYLIIKFNESKKAEKAEITIKMMDGHPDYR